MGFVLSPTRPTRLLAADPRNADVVRPYLVGEDLNQRPDGSPSRWVIDFRDWPDERARRVRRAVRASRAARATRARRRSTAQRIGTAGGSSATTRPALYRAIAPLDRCIAITRVSKVVQPMFVPTGIVFAHKARRVRVRRRRPLRPAVERIPLVVGGDACVDARNRVRLHPDRLLRDLRRSPTSPPAIGDLGGAARTRTAAR